MDVVCHGLSLPLTEHETIKDCVSVYCDWLTALCPTPNVTVPKPIVDDANVYGRKIINHFHNLFVPRLGEGKLQHPNGTALAHTYNTLRNIVHFCFCCVVLCCSISSLNPPDPECLLSRRLMCVVLPVNWLRYILASSCMLYTCYARI